MFLYYRQHATQCHIARGIKKTSGQDNIAPSINTSISKKQQYKANSYFKSYQEDFKSFINLKLNNNLAVSPENLIQSFIQAKGKTYDINSLMRSTETYTIYLDDKNSITLQGAYFYVHREEEAPCTPERISKGAIDTKNISKASARKTTGIKKYYHAVYALVLGQELYRITQEAQFTYNGSSVTANYSDGYYSRGFLSIWQVSDFQDSIKSTFNGAARVKSSANFHYGLEINGIGLVIQDHNCWVDIRCTKNGYVKGYCDGAHGDPIFDIL